MVTQNHCVIPLTIHEEFRFLQEGEQAELLCWGEIRISPTLIRTIVCGLFGKILAET